MLRRTVMAAADSQLLRRLASDVPLTRRVAHRFVAGERLDDALAVTRRLNQRGMAATLDYLGESVTSEGVARQAADVYLDALDRVAAEGLDCSVSVKLTQLGLDVSPDLAEKLVGEVCERSAAIGAHVTVDMEGSAYTATTVDVVARLRRRGHDNVGCAIQAYLHRSAQDVRRLTALQASLRICKGAYAEPVDIAYQDRHEVTASYLRLADAVLARSDTCARFATHDHQIIGEVRRLARRRSRRDGYELQMLYGVREPLQQRLVGLGERLRIYVPFGDQWYPYLTRRVAERPANLAFFLRALAGRRAR